MRSLSSCFEITKQSFRKWQTDYRVWVIGVLLVIMVQFYVDDCRKVSSALGTQIPICIFPFLYSQGYTKLIYTMMVILLFCNAPFTDSNQIFVYMRSGRRKWLWGQILYIIIASAVFYVFLFAVSLFSTFFDGEKTLGWGVMLNSVNDNVIGQTGANFMSISNIILRFFTPIQAVMFTFLLSWLAAVMIGLIIFFCNLVSQTRFLGILITSILTVVSCIIKLNNYFLYEFLPFSPVSWSTLDNVDVGGLTVNPSFEYCIWVYCGLILALSICILVFGQKKSLDTKGD